MGKVSISPGGGFEAEQLGIEVDAILQIIDA
jgi:hypothetical protein